MSALSTSACSRLRLTSSGSSDATTLALGTRLSGSLATRKLPSNDNGYSTGALLLVVLSSAGEGPVTCSCSPAKLQAKVSYRRSVSTFEAHSPPDLRQIENHRARCIGAPKCIRQS